MMRQIRSALRLREAVRRMRRDNARLVRDLALAELEITVLRRRLVAAETPRDTDGRFTGRRRAA